MLTRLESSEFKFINENQNNDEKNDKPSISSDSRIVHDNCNYDFIFDHNVHFNKSERRNLKLNEIGVFPISKFSEEDVKYWKILFEKYGNFTKVVEKFREYTRKIVSDFTVRRKLKDLLVNNYEIWYKKYKLSGKYSWEDACLWKNLYESLHSFKKVESFIKEEVYPNGPFEKTIREYLEKYINHILGENYDKWVERYHKTEPYKYNKKDYLYWQKLYEKLGSLKDVRDHLDLEIEGNPPDALIIRNGLKKILGNNYENWLKNHAKKPFSEDEILDWISQFEEKGTFKDVSERTGHGGETISKHIKIKLNDQFSEWYDTYSKHHERKWTFENAKLWKQLFEELGNYNEVRREIKLLYGDNTPSTSKIRRVVKRIIIESGENYDIWMNDFSLSDNLVAIGKMVHKILEFYFMENFNDDGIISFYEISPNKSYRVDNSIIVTPAFLNRTKIKISSCIRVINFDYTITSRLYTIYPKFRKGYHSDNIMLIVIPLFSTIDTFEFPLDIDYQNNIKILYINNFLKVFKFKSEMRSLISNTIELGKKAIFSPSSYEELRNLSNDLYEKLINKYGYRSQQQQDFDSYQ